MGSWRWRRRSWWRRRWWWWRWWRRWWWRWRRWWWWRWWRRRWWWRRKDDDDEGDEGDEEEDDDEGDEDDDDEGDEGEDDDEGDFGFCAGTSGCFGLAIIFCLISPTFPAASTAATCKIIPRCFSSITMFGDLDSRFRSLREIFSLFVIVYMNISFKTFIFQYLFLIKTFIFPASMNIKMMLKKKNYLVRYLI